MLKILGRNNSVNVQKVLWTCVELNIQFERTDIGGPFGGNDQADYLEKNPNGLVPTDEDGQLILWESNSIVRYLAAKYDDDRGFYPRDPGERALGDRWMDWQLSVFWPAFIPAFVALIRTAPEDRDQNVIDQAVAKGRKAAEILNQHLASQSFLGGEHLTMGDIPAGAVLYRWLNLEIDRPDHPHVVAYYDRLRERPGYQEHLMIGLS
jgi:glutathione S-transferase